MYVNLIGKMKWLWPAFLVSCFAADLIGVRGKSLAATPEKQDSYFIAREVILKVMLSGIVEISPQIQTGYCKVIA